MLQFVYNPVRLITHLLQMVHLILLGAKGGEVAELVTATAMATITTDKGAIVTLFAIWKIGHWKRGS